MVIVIAPNNKSLLKSFDPKAVTLIVSLLLFRFLKAFAKKAVDMI